MQHRELGDSGVEVSEVGFGAWVVGTDWWGDRGEAEAVEMVQHALDRGITYFDTGDVYGHGDSEELIGRALAEHREEVVVGTKIGYDFYDNPQAGHGELPKEMGVDYLETAFERSLERLGMDRVEFLQLHNANVAEVDDDVVSFLRGLKESGRVDAIGWALGPSIGWLAEGDRAIELDFDGVQTVFNLFEQGPGSHFVETIREREAAPSGAAADGGAVAGGPSTSLIARVPHSSGLLNEQVTPETDLGAGDHRAHRPTEWFEAGWEKLETIRFLEGDGERTMGQAAVRFLLAHDEVASVTPTFRTTDDIDEWAGAADVPALTDAEYERVQSLYADGFGVDRDDGMSAADYRSSVDGDDLREAGLLPE